MVSRLRFLFKREISKQALLFLLIGGVSTTINYSVFLIFFVLFSINYLISAVIGYLSGMIFGFFSNKIYTFKSKEGLRRSLPIYLGVYLFSLFLSIFLLNFFVENFNTNVLLTNLFLLVLTTLINFLGIKILAFKNRKW